MPIYEYQCKKCSTIFEEWLKASESELAQNCPKCNTKAERIVSQTSFVLKGSGWYVTEYGKDSASSTPAKENEESTTDKKTDIEKDSSNTKEKSSDSTNDTADSKPAKSDKKDIKANAKTKETKKPKKASSDSKKI